MSGTANYDKKFKNDKMTEILRSLVSMAGGVPEFAQAIGIEKMVIHEALNLKRRVSEEFIIKGVQVFCKSAKA